MGFILRPKKDKDLKNRKKIIIIKNGKTPIKYIWNMEVCRINLYYYNIIESKRKGINHV